MHLMTNSICHFSSLVRQWWASQPPPPKKRLSQITTHFVAAFIFPVSCWWPIDPVHWPSGEEDPRPLQDATSSTAYCKYLILNSLLKMLLHILRACTALHIFSNDFSRAVLCPSVTSLCLMISTGELTQCRAVKLTSVCEESSWAHLCFTQPLSPPQLLRSHWPLRFGGCNRGRLVSVFFRVQQWHLTQYPSRIRFSPHLPHITWSVFRLCLWGVSGPQVRELLPQGHP